MPKEIKKDQEEIPGGQEELDMLRQFMEELRRQINLGRRKSEQAPKDEKTSEE